jgi:hypothetical protein
MDGKIGIEDQPSRHSFFPAHENSHLNFRQVNQVLPVRKDQSVHQKWVAKQTILESRCCLAKMKLSRSKLPVNTFFIDFVCPNSQKWNTGHRLRSCPCCLLSMVWPFYQIASSNLRGQFRRSKFREECNLSLDGNWPRRRIGCVGSQASPAAKRRKLH